MFYFYFPGCQDGWSLYQSSCYRHFDTRLDWTKSQAACQEEKAVLASILDIGTNDFIKNLTSKSKTQIHYDQIWIGGFKPFGGSWMWVDNSTLGYENWHPREPSGDENCMTILGDSHNRYFGYWNDADCALYNWECVCEMKSSA